MKGNETHERTPRAVLAAVTVPLLLIPLCCAVCSGRLPHRNASSLSHAQPGQTGKSPGFPQESMFIRTASEECAAAEWDAAAPEADPSGERTDGEYPAGESPDKEHPDEKERSAEEDLKEEGPEADKTEGESPGANDSQSEEPADEILQKSEIQSGEGSTAAQAKDRTRAHPETSARNEETHPQSSSPEGTKGTLTPTDSQAESSSNVPEESAESSTETGTQPDTEPDTEPCLIRICLDEEDMLRELEAYAVFLGFEIRSDLSSFMADSTITAGLEEQGLAEIKARLENYSRLYLPDGSMTAVCPVLIRRFDQTYAAEPGVIREKWVIRIYYG